MSQVIGNFFKRYIIHIVFLFFYGLANLYMLFYNQSFFYFMMWWNAFLGFVPLLLSRLSVSLVHKKNWLWLLSFAVWFIFLPNAFYMVTDAIHFSKDNFYEFYTEAMRYRYLPDIHLWLKVFIIGAGTFYATLCGLQSLAQIQQLISARLGTAGMALFTLLTALLNGVAIYIGRFLRFNSWNILQMNSFIESWQYYGHDLRFTIGFILMVGVYIIAITTLYHYMVVKSAQSTINN